MITHEKQLLQVSTPRTWDEPTALAQVNDYICKPFAPVMQVIEKDTLADGRVRLLVKPVSASITEEWLVEAEQLPQLQQLQQTSTQEEVSPQPTGYAGDSVSCQLQPSPEAAAEYDSGHAHGMLDASYGSQPMCTEAECHYSAGYLNGYNSFRQLQPQPVVNKQTQWSVSYEPKWNWYWVWVGDRACGRASTIEEAERMAQQYVATDELTLFNHFNESKFCNPLCTRIYPKILQMKSKIGKSSLKARHGKRFQFRVIFFLP